MLTKKKRYHQFIKKKRKIELKITRTVIRMYDHNISHLQSIKRFTTYNLGTLVGRWLSFHIVPIPIQIGTIACRQAYCTHIKSHKKHI